MDSKTGSRTNGPRQLKSKVSVEIDKVRDFILNSLSISVSKFDLVV